MKKNNEGLVFKTILIAIIVGVCTSTMFGGIKDSIHQLSNSISDLANIPNNNSNDFIDMSIGEAAVHLNISKDDLQKIIDDDSSDIPYIKIGNKIVFYRHALYKWAESAQININKNE